MGWRETGISTALVLRSCDAHAVLSCAALLCPERMRNLIFLHFFFTDGLQLSVPVLVLAALPRVLHSDSSTLDQHKQPPSTTNHPTIKHAQTTQLRQKIKIISRPITMDSRLPSPDSSPPAWPFLVAPRLTPTQGATSEIRYPHPS